MGKSKSQEHHEDRREYTRIVIDTPVNILYKMQQLEARIHDISPDGLQIRTDSESLEKINPGNEKFTDTNAPLLNVTFRIKLFEMDMRINALCEMYYSNPIEGDNDINMACGLRFINFEGDGSLQIEAFITQEMSTF
jgi:hypothetical protein